MCLGSLGGCLLFSEHSLSTVPGLGCRSGRRGSAARDPTCLVFTSPQHPSRATEIPSVWPARSASQIFIGLGYKAAAAGRPWVGHGLRSGCEARAEGGLEGAGQAARPGSACVMSAAWWACGKPVSFLSSVQPGPGHPELHQICDGGKSSRPPFSLPCGPGWDSGGRP